MKKGTTGVTLVLDGLTLTSENTAAITCGKSSEVTILVSNGTENSLSDTEQNNDDNYPENENAENAVIKCKDGSTVTLCGDGELTVTANGKNGIKSGATTDEDGEALLTIRDLTLNIDAPVNDAINAEQLLNVESGMLTIDAADDAIHCDLVLNIGADGTDGPTIDITNCCEGLEGAELNVCSGDITINASDDCLNAANSDLTDYDFTMTISGGTIDAYSSAGDGFDSNGDLTITGGTVIVWTANTADNEPLDADGTITAEAYNAKGEKIDTSTWQGRQSVTTTGKAAKLKAEVNREGMTANGTDLAYVTVSVTDAEGNVIPNATNNVTFKVTGSGSLAGIDNGNSPDHQSYRDDNRDAFSGQLVGIVRAGEKAGDATVTVSADGLESTTITIPVAASSDAPESKAADSLYFARYHYVKTGSALELPATVQVRYSDGTSENKAVTWDNVPADKLATPGSFTVSGTIADTPVRATAVVTVVDDIAALLNYSTTVSKGAEPVLPDSLPAVMADGTVLNANFPVTWSAAEDGAYDKAGTVMLPARPTCSAKMSPLPLRSASRRRPSPSAATSPRMR